MAIGNSITKHEICDYWWNEIGMAATTAENDYFHRVEKWLTKEKGDVKANAFGFAVWEMTAHDRFQTLQLLDKYLEPAPDLITIQLGENVVWSSD